jgi:DNA polymerase-3 subunit alpha
MGLETALAKWTDCTLAELRDFDPDSVGVLAGGPSGEGQLRTVGGVVTDLSRRYTKKGELMATFVLEDLQSSMEVFVFPKTMAEYGALLEDDAIVVLKGRIDLRDDQMKLVCMEVRRPELTTEAAGELHIALPIAVLTDTKVEELKRLLTEHAGDAPVFLHVGEKILRLPPAYAVTSRPGLVGELRVLLGPNAIAV